VARSCITDLERGMPEQRRMLFTVSSSQSSGEESEIGDTGRTAGVNIPIVINVTSSTCRSGSGYAQGSDTERGLMSPGKPYPPYHAQLFTT
jgi:hypothetical protein